MIRAGSGSRHTVAGTGAGIRPGQGRSGGQLGILGVAERHQRRLLGRAAPAGQHRARHRAVAEHGLHPEGGAGDPVADHRVAPQAELAAPVADKLIGNQPQHDDPAGLDPVPAGIVLGRPGFALVRVAGLADD